MKNLILCLIAIYSLLSGICKAQWQQDVRLTNNPAASGGPSISVSGSAIHVVWGDLRDANYEIYYKRSTDGGISWETDTRLTNNSASSGAPSISLSGSAIHVVWQDLRDGNPEIYYKRSTDGGINWETDTRLTNNPAISQFPNISVSGSAIHVVWFDIRDGNREIYYKRSTDGGINWETDTRLTNNPANSWYPASSVSGSTIHVLWYDERDGNYEIYYKRSTDGGINWETDTRLTNNPAISRHPAISVSGSAINLVWEDERDGNYEIYYKRSTDGGINWETDTRLTNNFANSWSPVISVSGSAVHVAWWDLRDGNYEIYYKRSTDGGINWETDTRLTNSPSTSEYPVISVSGSAIHVVWYDLRDGNEEIYYKQNPTGNITGITNINLEIPNQFSLSQNYPNPFNPTTQFKFEIPKSGFVKLIVYDIMGKEIESLISGELNAGVYEDEWNAENFSGGTYFYKLTAGDYAETKKMILIK